MAVKCILFLFCCLLYNNHQAQKQQYLFKTYVGDLNNDKIPDEIYIREIKCKGSYDDEDGSRVCRVATVILYEDKDKDKSTSWTNSNIVPCSFCSEDEKDPFKEVKIKKNGFSFISVSTNLPSGMKIKKTITFKYDKNRNNFILFKVIQEMESYENGDIKRKVNTETTKDFGIITFSDYF